MPRRVKYRAVRLSEGEIAIARLSALGEIIKLLWRDWMMDDDFFQIYLFFISSFFLRPINSRLCRRCRSFVGQNGEAEGIS